MTNIVKHESHPVVQYLQSDSTKSKFQQVLGQKAPQFIASIISATQTNDKLLECKPDSLTNSALIAATLDLPINASLGMAYLVPYKKGNTLLCQFQIGWKGLVQLAIRTGMYETINVTQVYDGQLIDEDPFTGEYTFDKNAKKSDKVIGYVAYFKLLTGFKKQYYWTKEMCEAHAMKYSQSYKGQYKESSLWYKDFDGMAMKTVLKLLLDKFGPKSVEMQNAIIHDQGVADDVNQEPQYPDNPQNDFTHHVVVEDKEITISSNKQEIASSMTDNLAASISEPKKEFSLIDDTPEQAAPVYINKEQKNNAAYQSVILKRLEAIGFTKYEDVLPTLNARMIEVPTKEEFLHHGTLELVSAIESWVAEDNQEGGL